MRFTVVGKVLRHTERMPSHTHDYRPRTDSWGVPRGELCVCGAFRSTGQPGSRPNVSRET